MGESVFLLFQAPMDCLHFPVFDFTSAVCKTPNSKLKSSQAATVISGSLTQSQKASGLLRTCVSRSDLLQGNPSRAVTVMMKCLSHHERLIYSQVLRLRCFHQAIVPF